MKLLKGSDVAAAIKKRIQIELEEIMKFSSNNCPELAIVRVGEKPDDISYEKGARKRLESLGLKATSFPYREKISSQEFLRELEKINQKETIDGILILSPLPEQIDEKEVGCLISPEKDVDGISPWNRAKVFSGEEDGFIPCTAEAVMETLDYADINLTGKRVTIIGRSLVVGRPLMMLLIKKNATVTVCHTKTKNIREVCKDAEILIVAAGQPKMVDDSFIREGAAVIDVGIHVEPNGKLCGDVNQEAVKKASFLTPVPGGIGAITTLILAEHVIKARRKK